MEERKDICEGYERDSVQQLDKLAKDKNERFPIYPLTYIQAVYDARTKERLDSILWKCNNVYLPWMGSAGDTRIQLPFWMRRKGIIITYKNLDEETITEKLTYDLCIADDFFRLDSSWTRITDALPVGGNITIGSNGNWFQDGVDTGFKAQGPKGDNGLTPMLRTVNNKLRYSYDGEVWNEISEYIAAWFRYQDNKIQISRDQKTWSDLSKPFTQDLYIKGYVATSSALPSTGVKQGDIYMVGPTYAAEDTEHKNPIYRMYVYNDSGWVDNGVFQSIAAGVVQTIGNSETEVMSQKAVSSIVGLDTYPVFSDTKPYVKGEIVNYGGLLYEFTADHEAGAWIGTDARETSLREEIEEKIKKLNRNLSRETSFSGFPNVYLGEMYSFTNDIGHWIENEKYDAAIIKIYDDQGYLKVQGAIPQWFIFFESEEILDNSHIYVNQSGKILPKAKLCVIDFLKEDNTAGYADLRVTQDNVGVSRSELKSAYKDAIGDLFVYEGGAVREDGTFAFDGEITTSNLGLTDYLPLLPNKKITIIAGLHNLSVNLIPIAFYDKDYKFISCYTGEKNEIDHTYTIEPTDIPENAKYVVASGNRSYGDPMIYGVDIHKYLKDKIKSDYVELSGMLHKAYVDKHKFINVSDEFVKYSSSSIYDSIRIEIPSGLKYFKISGIKALAVVWFSSTVVSSETYLGVSIDYSHNYTVLESAVMAVINVKIADNPNGYKDLRIERSNYGAITKEREIEFLDESGLIEYIDSDTPTLISKNDGYYRHDDDILITSDYVHNIYSVKDTNRYHIVIPSFKQESPIYLIEYLNDTDKTTCADIKIEINTDIDTVVTPPKGTVKMVVNYRDRVVPIVKQTTPQKINVKDELNNNGDPKSKLMKVNIKGLSTDEGSTLFYVRSKYNANKDIIVKYWTNYNGLVSPSAAYIGSNTLSDDELQTSSYIVSDHSDSTGPLLGCDVYWHLFAQHGYVIPKISNNTDLDFSDLNSRWKDQLDREYTIGNINSTYVYLLPVITSSGEGTDTRGWKTPYDAKITELTHVSGAQHTTQIIVTSQTDTQLRPIMESADREFMIDGRKITDSGVYYCDEFKVSERQIGYDPASISTWFPAPELTNAREMALFTWSYNFKGSTCCVNTTVDIRRKVRFQKYGATQQQTFMDKDDYKAMFMIPKTKAQNGVELDKPFNSPTSESQGYSFFRTTNYLKDVNDPIDRLIAFLYNPNSEEYLVGMAAGLSLVSGDTVTEKRIQNIPITTNTTNFHYNLGTFSPSNKNKFYIGAINAAPFADDDFNFPNTYFKEINYYVSYFDPAENKGQVYWYKDGNNYVIYMHCQTKEDRIFINLPYFMEGLNVEIVEKTDGATLHTTVIQNGKLYVSYTNDANYIVLKTK